MNPCIKEALLYQKLEGNKIKCKTCGRFCIIPKGKFGLCKSRKNNDGKLYTLEYGNISSINPNPIEKKPFFHFYPGSLALTVGSWSCNFTCFWCQNWEISKFPPSLEKSNYISPEKFIDLLEFYKCQGVSISFNEPTLMLEYSLDVFDLAKKKGYYNTFVTNGYMSLEALRFLVDHGLDAMNIDIKGDEEAVRRYCGADVNHVWKIAIEAKKFGVWVEITTLIIPEVNDDEECLRSIARRIFEELGNEVPWHLSRYYPAYKFTKPPTPVESLERARKIGIEEGLKYVYIGNVAGHEFENTYCPSCNELLIQRYVFDIISYKITKDKKCPKCGESIPIIGSYVKRFY